MIKKLEKKDVDNEVGKTYFMFVGNDADFVRKVKSEFGLSNSELGQYCLDLLRATIKYPEVIEFINKLETKK